MGTGFTGMTYKVFLSTFYHNPSILLIRKQTDVCGLFTRLRRRLPDLRSGFTPRNDDYRANSFLNEACEKNKVEPSLRKTEMSVENTSAQSGRHSRATEGSVAIGLFFL